MDAVQQRPACGTTRTFGAMHLAMTSVSPVMERRMATSGQCPFTQGGKGQPTVLPEPSFPLIFFFTRLFSDCKTKVRVPGINGKPTADT